MNSLLNLLELECKVGVSLLPNDRLNLATSAGQDSTFLCICFLILQSQWNFSITTIYCNHLWQIESIQLILHLLNFYYLTNIDFIVINTINNLSNETNSRIWRYTLIERLTFLTQSKFILVGHSKNDQLESFILNLFRGSGPIGLLTLTKKRLNYFPQFRCFSEKKQQISFINKYIQVNRKISVISILRPLLKLNRYEISMLIKNKAFPVWTDRTNFYTQYNRNRIRIELLPLIRFYFNPNVDLCILRCIQILDQEFEFLQSLSYSALNYSLVSILDKKLIIHDKNFFYSLPYIFQKRLIIESLKIFNYSNINYKIILRIFKSILLMNQIKKCQILQIQQNLIIISYLNFIIISLK